MSDQDKDFMGKVADVAGEVANVVAKTTSDLYQKGKQQIEVARARSDIREQYKTLGELEYAIRKGRISDTAEIDQGVSQLDELFEKLDALEEEFKVERERREAAREAARAEREKNREPVEVKFESERCPVCEQPRIGAYVYCANCGARYPDLPEQEDESEAQQ